MRLYSGPTRQFVSDAIQNQISDKMASAFHDYYGWNANPAEVYSWVNSLQFVKNIVEYSNLNDNHIVLEYELPYTTRRIDCILFGKGRDEKDNVVVLELKQWSDVTDCDVQDNIITYVGGGNRMVPHPSIQVRGYHYHLENYIEAVQDGGGLGLSSCVYCHNYDRVKNPLLVSEKFKDVIEDFPVFTKNDVTTLGEYLKRRLERGNGFDIFGTFSTSRISPSKKLIEQTRQMVDGQRIFSLIDEQLTANNTIIDRAKKASKTSKKTVILVRGGPGTGKSVIALNAVAELLSLGKVVYHATGSKSFTMALRKATGPRVQSLFKYFNSFGEEAKTGNAIDVLVCDEAHRIRSSSNSRFTPKAKQTSLPQVEELINASKVTIFFIDDFQVVRSGEIGSSALITSTAKKFGAELFEFELTTQFRCSGSDTYLKWVNNVLDIEENDARVLPAKEKMDFRIFDSGLALHQEIKRLNQQKPNSARLVAGFCWPWSDPRPDGTLVDDVIVDDLRIPWEAKEEGKLAKGIPRWYEWAYDPNGVNQCGCIYTAQGFEFEYIGVIVGKDLMWDSLTKNWVGHPENSHDSMLTRSKGDFTEYVKNIYRVLLTRGMKGCYVHFLDKETEKHFREHIESK